MALPGGMRAVHRQVEGKRRHQGMTPDLQSSQVVKALWRTPVITRAGTHERPAAEPSCIEATRVEIAERGRWCCGLRRVAPVAYTREHLPTSGLPPLRAGAPASALRYAKSQVDWGSGAPQPRFQTSLI